MVSRRLLSLTVFFALGIAIAGYVYPLATRLVWAVLFALAVAGGGACGWLAPAGWRRVVAWFLALVLGLVMTWWQLSTGPAALAASAGRTVRVSGVVARPPDVRDDVVYLVVRVNAAGQRVLPWWSRGRLVRLSVSWAGDKPSFAPGDRVQAFLRLERPSPAGNPGQMDYRAYLQSQGIFYVAKVAASEIHLTARGRPGLARTAFSLRSRLVGAIRRQIPGPQGSLVEGLIFGGGQTLPDEIQTDFRRAGVYHILAVSGSNVAFIAGGVQFIWRLLRVGQRWRTVMTAWVIVFYAFMTGMGPPVVRATVMALAVLGARLAGERADAFTALALAGLVQLLENPLSLYDPGWQLSFFATAGILWLYGPAAGVLHRLVPGRAGIIVPTLAATLTAQAGVTPVSLWHFFGISAISLVSNLVIVPVSGFVVTYGTAASIAGALWPGAGTFLQRVTWLAASLLIVVADWAARVPGGFWWLGRPPLLAVVAFYLAVIQLGRKAKGQRQWRWWLGLFLLAAVGFGWRAVAGGGPGLLKITVLDVGEGDSIVIAPPGGPWMLLDGGSGGFGGPGDSGGKAGGGTGRGESVVLPFVHFHGMGRVGDFIVSHGHDDHAGGLVPALAELRPKAVWVGAGTADCPAPALDALQAEARRLAVPVLHPAEGFVLPAGRGGDLQVRFLHTGAVCDDPAGMNDTSLVVTVTYGRVSFLFPGDLGTGGEEELIKRYPDLAATVLKVGHHGSTSSTSLAWLDALHPRLAVISVGTNLYGHPSPAVLARLSAKGVPVYRTDECGAVTLVTDGQKVMVKPFRGRGQDLNTYAAKSFKGESCTEMVLGAGDGGFAQTTKGSNRYVLSGLRH